MICPPCPDATPPFPLPVMLAILCGFTVFLGGLLAYVLPSLVSRAFHAVFRSGW